MESDLSYQQTIFANRLRKRYRHLRKWAKREGVFCYRLYDRDIPEVPLAVDLYDAWLHVSEYESPHKNLPGTPDEYRSAMIEAAAEATGHSPANIFYKRRRRMAATEHYARQSARSVTALVCESDLSFEINLTDYIDVGLFLDHRITRSRVETLVSRYHERGSVRMLNLFSYTGSFTVYAARAGAETTSVDLSKTYTEWAKRNLTHNGFTDARHTVVAADVVTYLRKAEQEKRRYEVIVVDPPTFSASKKTDYTFSVQRDHGPLLEGCTKLLTPGGTIVFGTNLRGFRLKEVPVGLSVTDISEETIPEDFRNRRIHSAWLLRRQSELPTRMRK